MKRWTMRLAAVGLILLLTGCGDDATPEQAANAAAPARSAERSPLIDYIPADAPFLLANLEPVPDAVAEKIWVAVEPMMQVFEKQAQAVIDRASQRDDLTEEERLWLAMAREMSGKFNREGLTSLGLNASFFAMYGDGLAPVVRLALNDGELFDAALGRVEADADASLQKSAASGYSYIEGGDDKVRALMALVDGQAVMTIAPAGEGSQGVVDRILSGAKPAQSAAQRIDAINAAQGFLPYGTFVADTGAIMDAVLRDDSPLAQAMFGDVRSGLSDVCISEFRAMADVAPRLIGGYTEFNENVITNRNLIELRPDVAAGMASIGVAMPGLMQSDRGIMSAAFGIDIMALREFAKTQVAAIKADPYQCELMAEMMTDLDQVEMQLNQPLPPMVGNFQGVRVQVDKLEMDEAGGEPRVEGLLALGVINPQALIGMGQMMMPELATLQMSYDGTPVAFPEGLAPPQLVEPFVAATNDGVAVSFGPGRSRDLKTFLDAPRPEGQPPLMALSYDMAAFGQFQQRMMDRSMEQQIALAEGSDATERVAAMAELTQAMQSYSEMIKRVSMTIVATEAGLEFVSRTQLN